MSGASKIEWTDATWNPVTGCTKVSAGCKNCYAERLWPRIEGARIKRAGGVARPFTDVRVHAERLDAPLRWREPRRIFVNSMSDLFHEDVPDEFIDRVFAVMALCPQHRFQILTKRPERMLAYMATATRESLIAGWIEDQYDQLMQRLNVWPLRNVWHGASIEDQPTADARVPFFFKQWGEWANSDTDARESWTCADRFVRVDGTTHSYADGEVYSASDALMHRVGKRAAGRLLDGREWSEFPRSC